MYYYFEDNYMWSSAFNLALMSGGELGEMHRWLAPLRGTEPDNDAWAAAWAEMAHQQEALAARDLKSGFPTAAGRRYLRASVYHASGERQIPPGPAKSESYSATLQAFANALEHLDLPLEHMEIESPDGALPGYLIKADADGPAPVVIFFGGFDVTKELLYCFIDDTFRKRGIHVAVVDTPGVGEPLRLRGVPSRPDYEVPTGAIIDHLQTRSDVDVDRIGVMGISLGGYYAPRAATFEDRIKACVAWGAIWDWGKTWEHRWGTRSKTVSVPWFQLPWVMGTETMEEALEVVKQFSLVDVLPQLTKPYLILHGQNDRQIAIDDAYKAFEAAASEDKQMHVFTVEEGGAEHCQTDEPDPARNMIADWFVERL